MNKFLKIIKFLCKPKQVYGFVLERYLTWLPEKFYLKLLFKKYMGYSLDLNNPKTFSEKLQWLKLYDRKKEYTKMVDKFAVKDYVSSIIGDEYIIPTLAVWNTPEEIEWDSLPQKFVLKTTHSGGSLGVVVCRDKSLFDKEEAVSRLNRAMKDDIYRHFKEWPYKDVQKRIIAEKYLEPVVTENDLPDYKFFCFNGEPKYCQVISGRDSTMCVDFFDMDWKHQPFHEPREYPFSGTPIEKPHCFRLMYKLAALLAEEKPFSRIDFYEVGHRVFFGEITFFPTSGMGGFEPKDWDLKFGEMLEL